MPNTTALDIYRRALRLYPETYRREFGPEMAETFEDAARDARADGRLPLVRLYLREIRGLVLGILAQTTAREIFGRMSRRWSAPLLGGLIAGCLFLLGAVFAGGPFIFSPLLNVLALGVLGAGSIWLARAWARPARTAPRLVHSGLALFLILGAVPAARLFDSVYLDQMAAQGRTLRYTVPGIEISASSTNESGRRGLLGQVHTRTNRGAGRRELVAVWHRSPASPPYELIVVLLAVGLTLGTHELGRSHKTTERS